MFRHFNAETPGGTLPQITESEHMKWKNFDCGAGCYYITSTFTDWMELFKCQQILQIVKEEIIRAAEDCGAIISAYVFMPNHLHLLVYLPEECLLHRFCKLWRGRSARRITLYLSAECENGESDSCMRDASGVSALKCRNIGGENARSIVARMASHANGTARYTAWKEQPRALFVWSRPVLQQKIDYIHNNPCRRSLVEHPGDWPYSSWRFYEGDGRSLLPIGPWPE
ncbi:MAG: transposase [Armatimonadota bacterium]